MHPRFLNDVFAQVIDADVHQLDRIQRTAPQMWRSSGVGRPALEAVGDLVVGEHGDRHDAVGPERMPGNRRINVVKNAIACHERLAGPPLLAGAAVVTDDAGKPCPLQHALDGNRRRQRRRAEQIVAATVAGAPLDQRGFFRNAASLAHSGQRVEFTQDGDDRPFFAIASHESSGDVGEIFRHRKTLRFEFCGQQRDRLEFLEAHFGQPPDVAAQLFKTGTVFVEPLVNQFFIHLQLLSQEKEGRAKPPSLFLHQPLPDAGADGQFEEIPGAEQEIPGHHIGEGVRHHQREVGADP